MTSKDRLTRALAGEPVDRIPVFPQIPFALSEKGFEPGAFHGYADYDDWRRDDPAYWGLVRRMETECDNFFIYRPSCMSLDAILFGSDVECSESRRNTGETVVFERACHGLSSVSAIQPGTGHTWQLEHWCKTAEDARRMLDLPWTPPAIDMDDFEPLQSLLGDRGVFWITVPSPILIACRLFDPSEFLMFASVERDLLHELLETFAERIRGVLSKMLDAGAGPIIRFGGAEHATPPLMSPADFDDLVVRYDGPLVELCKSRGRLTAVHCHGRIQHALQRFVEMGLDQTDPVETVPDGDLTMPEARKIAGNQITLTGNIQMRELHESEPAAIRERIRRLMAEAGPTRFVLGTTGTPLERMTPLLARNYNEFIDAGLEYGADGTVA